MTLLDELKDRFTTKHIKHDLKAWIEIDGWREGEVNRAAIFDEYEDFTLSALIETFTAIEDKAASSEKFLDIQDDCEARLEVLGYLIASLLDVWSDQGLRYLVDSINDLVKVIVAQEAEIKDIRNTLKKHHHPMFGVYTGRAEWV